MSSYNEWEADLSSIIEKTNHNLKLLRRIGEKRTDLAATSYDVSTTASVRPSTAASASQIATDLRSFATSISGRYAAEDHDMRARVLRSHGDNGDGRVSSTSSSTRKLNRSSSTGGSSGSSRSGHMHNAVIRPAVPTNAFESSEDDGDGHGHGQVHSETLSRSHSNPRASGNHRTHSIRGSSSASSGREGEYVRMEPKLTADAMEDMRKSLETSVAAHTGAVDKKLADWSTDMTVLTNEMTTLGRQLAELKDAVESKMSHVPGVLQRLQETGDAIARLEKHSAGLLGWKVGIDQDVMEISTKMKGFTAIHDKMSSLETHLESLANAIKVRSRQQEEERERMEELRDRLSTLERQAANQLDAKAIEHMVQLRVAREMHELESRVAQNMAVATQKLEAKYHSLETSVQSERVAATAMLKSELADELEKFDARALKRAELTPVMAAQTQLKEDLAQMQAYFERQDKRLMEVKQHSTSIREELGETRQELTKALHAQQNRVSVTMEDKVAQLTILAKDKNVRAEQRVSLLEKKHKKMEETVRTVQESVTRVKQQATQKQAASSVASQREHDHLRQRLARSLTELEQVHANKQELERQYEKQEKHLNVRLEELRTQLEQQERDKEAQRAELVQAIQHEAKQMGVVQGRNSVLESLLAKEKRDHEDKRQQMHHSRQEMALVKQRMRALEHDVDKKMHKLSLELQSKQAEVDALGKTLQRREEEVVRLQETSQREALSLRKAREVKQHELQLATMKLREMEAVAASIVQGWMPAPSPSPMKFGCARTTRQLSSQQEEAEEMEEEQEYAYEQDHMDTDQRYANECAKREELEGLVVSRQRELDEMKQELANMSLQQEEATQRHRELVDKTVIRVSSEFDEKLSALREEISRRDDELEMLRTNTIDKQELQDLEASLEAVKLEKCALVEKLKEMQEEAQRTEDAHQRAAENASAERQAYSNLELAHATEVEALRCSIEERVQELEEVQDSLKESHSRIAVIEEEMFQQRVAHSEELQVLTQQLGDARREVERLVTECGQLEADKKRVETALAEYQSALEAVRTENEQRDTEELAALRQHEDALISERDQLQAQLQAKQEELGDVLRLDEQRRAELELALADQESTNSRLREEANALHQTLEQERRRSRDCELELTSSVEALREELALTQQEANNRVDSDVYAKLLAETNLLTASVEQSKRSEQDLQAHLNILLKDTMALAESSNVAVTFPNEDAGPGNDTAIHRATTSRIGEYVQALADATMSRTKELFLLREQHEQAVHEATVEANRARELDVAIQLHTAQVHELERSTAQLKIELEQCYATEARNASEIGKLQQQIDSMQEIKQDLERQLSEKVVAYSQVETSAAEMRVAKEAELDELRGTNQSLAAIISDLKNKMEEIEAGREQALEAMQVELANLEAFVEECQNGKDSNTARPADQSDIASSVGGASTVGIEGNLYANQHALVAMAQRLRSLSASLATGCGVLEWHDLRSSIFMEEGKLDQLRRETQNQVSKCNAEEDEIVLNAEFLQALAEVNGGNSDHDSRGSRASFTSRYAKTAPDLVLRLRRLQETLASIATTSNTTSAKGQAHLPGQDEVELSNHDEVGTGFDDEDDEIDQGDALEMSISSLQATATDADMEESYDAGGDSVIDGGDDGEYASGDEDEGSQESNGIAESKGDATLDSNADDDNFYSADLPVGEPSRVLLDDGDETGCAEEVDSHSHNGSHAERSQLSLDDADHISRSRDEYVNACQMLPQSPTAVLLPTAFRPFSYAHAASTSAEGVVNHDVGDDDHFHDHCDDNESDGANHDSDNIADETIDEDNDNDVDDDGHDDDVSGTYREESESGTQPSEQGVKETNSESSDRQSEENGAEYIDLTLNLNLTRDDTLGREEAEDDMDDDEGFQSNSGLNIAHEPKDDKDDRTVSKLDSDRNPPQSYPPTIVNGGKISEGGSGSGNDDGAYNDDGDDACGESSFDRDDADLTPFTATLEQFSSELASECAANLTSDSAEENVTKANSDVHSDREDNGEYYLQTSIDNTHLTTTSDDGLSEREDLDNHVVVNDNDFGGIEENQGEGEGDDEVIDSDKEDEDDRTGVDDMDQGVSENLDFPRSRDFDDTHGMDDTDLQNDSMVDQCESTESRLYHSDDNESDGDDDGKRQSLGNHDQNDSGEVPRTHGVAFASGNALDSDDAVGQAGMDTSNDFDDEDSLDRDVSGIGLNEQEIALALDKEGVTSPLNGTGGYAMEEDDDDSDHSGVDNIDDGDEENGDEEGSEYSTRQVLAGVDELDARYGSMHTDGNKSEILQGDSAHFGDNAFDGSDRDVEEVCNDVENEFDDEGEGDKIDSGRENSCPIETDDDLDTCDHDIGNRGHDMENDLDNEAEGEDNKIEQGAPHQHIVDNDFDSSDHNDDNVDGETENDFDDDFDNYNERGRHVYGGGIELDEDLNEESADSTDMQAESEEDTNDLDEQQGDRVYCKNGRDMDVVPAIDTHPNGSQYDGQNDLSDDGIGEDLNQDEEDYHRIDDETRLTLNEPTTMVSFKAEAPPSSDERQDRHDREQPAHVIVDQDAEEGSGAMADKNVDQVIEAESEHGGIDDLAADEDDDGGGDVSNEEDGAIVTHASMSSVFGSDVNTSLTDRGEETSDGEDDRDGNQPAGTTAGNSLTQTVQSVISRKNYTDDADEHADATGTTASSQFNAIDDDDFNELNDAISDRNEELGSSFDDPDDGNDLGNEHEVAHQEQDSDALRDEVQEDDALCDEEQEEDHSSSLDTGEEQIPTDFVENASTPFANIDIDVNGQDSRKEEAQNDGGDELEQLSRQQSHGQQRYDDDNEQGVDDDDGDQLNASDSSFDEMVGAEEDTTVGNENFATRGEHSIPGDDQGKQSLYALPDNTERGINPSGLCDGEDVDGALDPLDEMEHLMQDHQQQQHHLDNSFDDEEEDEGGAREVSIQKEETLGGQEEEDEMIDTGSEEEIDEQLGSGEEEDGRSNAGHRSGAFTKTNGSDSNEISVTDQLIRVAKGSGDAEDMAADVRLREAKHDENDEFGTTLSSSRDAMDDVEKLLQHATRLEGQDDDDLEDSVRSGDDHPSATAEDANEVEESSPLTSPQAPAPLSSQRNENKPMSYAESFGGRSVLPPLTGPLSGLSDNRDPRGHEDDTDEMERLLHLHGNDSDGGLDFASKTAELSAVGGAYGDFDDGEDDQETSHLDSSRFQRHAEETTLQYDNADDSEDCEIDREEEAEDDETAGASGNFDGDGDADDGEGSDDEFGFGDTDLDSLLSSGTPKKPSHTGHLRQDEGDDARSDDDGGATSESDEEREEQSHRDTVPMEVSDYGLRAGSASSLSASSLAPLSSRNKLPTLPTLPTLGKLPGLGGTGRRMPLSDGDDDDDDDMDEVERLLLGESSLKATPMSKLSAHRNYSVANDDADDDDGEFASIAHVSTLGTTAPSPLRDPGLPFANDDDDEFSHFDRDDDGADGDANDDDANISDGDDEIRVNYGTDTIDTQHLASAGAVNELDANESGSDAGLEASFDLDESLHDDDDDAER